MAHDTERSTPEALTPDQRLEAAAIIIRDAVEEMLTAKAARRPSAVGCAA